MENVLISGGTGLVGLALTKMLTEEGYQVTILSRSKKGSSGNVKYVSWDPSQRKLDQEVIKNADHIINLAGANVGDKRWTERYKKLIYDSRIDSTRLLVETVNQTTNPVKTFINASASGYYGSRDEQVTEDSTPGEDFLAKVCLDWENEVHQLTAPNTRKVILRMGIILSAKGGALQQLVSPVKLGAAAPLGSGKQMMPWIHIDDLCRMYLFAIKEANVSGAINAVAPNPVSNKTMTQTIAGKLQKPMFLPNVPGFALKILVGEFAETLLANQNLSAEKIQKKGFEFKFPSIDKALENLLTT